MNMLLGMDSFQSFFEFQLCQELVSPLLTNWIWCLINVQVTINPMEWNGMDSEDGFQFRPDQKSHNTVL
jgi:hypothetical protein